MQIFVKTLTGKTITLGVKLSDTVLSLKQKVRFCSGIPPEEQLLIFGSRELEDDSTPSDDNIQLDSVIIMSPEPGPLSAGPNFTSPYLPESSNLPELPNLHTYIQLILAGAAWAAFSSGSGGFTGGASSSGCGSRG